jgi:integrase
MTSSVTVRDLLSLYAAEYLPSKAPGTCYQQGRLYQRMSADFGDMLLADLTPAWLRTWRDQLATQYKPGTVRGYLELLSGALRIAVEDYQWLDENPLDRVKRPSPAKTRVRFLSDTERPALLDACRQSANPALYVIVLLALSTGARKMELLSLRWEDVDLEQGLLRLADTKNGEGRAVPVPPRVMAALVTWGQTRRQSIPLVFPARDGSKPMSISSAWRFARQRAGLQNFRYHDLRHTAASYLAMSGASVREIAEVLGHASLAMAMRYIHLSAPHVRGVVERMSDKFLT